MIGYVGMNRVSIPAVSQHDWRQFWCQWDRKAYATGIWCVERCEWDDEERNEDEVVKGEE